MARLALLVGALLAVSAPAMAAPPSGLLLHWQDGAGRSLADGSVQATLSRALPPGVITRFDAEFGSDEAESLVLSVTGARLPDALFVDSFSPGARLLGSRARLPLARVDCPKGSPSSMHCAKSPRLRVSLDPDELRSDPQTLVLPGELGGWLSLDAQPGTHAPWVELAVLGPQGVGLGPAGRLRGRLRVRVLRLVPGGAPVAGTTDEGAIELMREELRQVERTWGQCGIGFGPAEQADIAVVDPPPPWLLVLGCELGLPASGGRLALQIAGKRVELKLKTGERPSDIAARLTALLAPQGVRARSFVNPRIQPGAGSSVDLRFYAADGRPLLVEATPDLPLSDDSTLGVCIGEVELEDGLSHFVDVDSGAGTTEERALVQGLSDQDPTSIEVFVVSTFLGGGRIGESFVARNGSRQGNAVVVDRVGLTQGNRSFVLAHELGHILLAIPGHPDDYGVDQPYRLMDSDASDPTRFGPWRLSLADCRRAVRESGPQARQPLLSVWPWLAPDAAHPVAPLAR